MEQVYQWVRNILFFTLLVNLTETLLPSGKYEKYIRFFAGMVLIILAVRPLLGMLQLEDRLAGYFETFSFQMETDELNREILGVESQRLDRIIDEYEAEAERNIAVMAEEEGLNLSEANVTVVRDREKDTYGQISHILLTVEEHVSGKDKGSSGESIVRAGEEKTVSVREIEPVQVEVMPAGADVPASPRTEQFRRKVEMYYGLEPEELEIRLEGMEKQ